MPTSEPAHIRILAPGGNWVRLGGQIALGLAGYPEPLGPGSGATIHLGHPGILCMQAPRLVGEGQFHLAFTTPAWYARSCMEGRGIFPDHYDLRAIGVFAHNDR